MMYVFEVCRQSLDTRCQQLRDKFCRELVLKAVYSCTNLLENFCLQLYNVIARHQRNDGVDVFNHNASGTRSDIAFSRILP
jgi:hypothetical protein